MKNPPRISVVTICLNAASTIGATLRSVLNQNYPALEYIVVDGGSTDGTLNIVEQYRSSLARVISEPDRGIYDAINKGIAASTGDITGILNSGDLYAPWTFGAILRAMKSNPGCGVYLGHTMLLDEDVGKWRVAYLGKDWREKFKRYMVFCHQSTFIAREIYALHGLYSTEYALASDWDYFLKLNEAGVNFCQVDAVLSAFLLGGVTTSKLPEVLNEMIAIAGRHKIDMTEMKKYHEAAMRSYTRMKWTKKMWLKRLIFRLRELVGYFQPSGEWRASMEQEIFMDYLRKTESQAQ